MITPLASVQQPVRGTRMHRLEVEPLGPLSWDFRVRADGRDVATLSLARFRERGGFELAGVAHDIVAEGFLRRTYRLERGGLVTARAQPRGVFRPSFVVNTGDRVLTLRPVGFFGRTYKVEHGRTPMGEIRRLGVFRRGAAGELDERIEPGCRILLICIAVLQWRHQSRRSS